MQTVQALKAASSQMKGAMKTNKELDLGFIDSLQVHNQVLAERWMCVAGTQLLVASPSRTLVLHPRHTLPCPVC